MQRVSVPIIGASRSCWPIPLPVRACCGNKRSHLTTKGPSPMANKILDEESLKQVGRTGEPRTYEVERGAIRRFAEAIGDSSPLFNDEQRARESRFGGII